MTNRIGLTYEQLLEEVLELEAENARLRKALAVAQEELEPYLKTSYRLRAEESLLRIAKVLEGK